MAPGSTVEWPGAPPPRIVIDERTLAFPRATADLLHRHWVERTPVIIDLGIDANELRARERSDLEPYQLPYDFDFALERLHFLVWANNYDMRSGSPVWWWTAKAAGLGVTPGRPADGVLDGAPVWCDGGPREPLDLEHAVLHRETIELGRLPRRPVTPGGPESLAPDQEVAVNHRGGPARIIAPAGSGKTRTLAARTRLLLDHRGIEGEILTAVAYNTEAARELAERVGRPGSIRTIHSLGYSIIRRSRGPVNVIDEREVRRIVEQLTPIPRQSNRDGVAPYLEALTESRIGLVAPDVVESRRDDVPGFGDLFPRYRAALSASAAIDFDEQIYGAIEALIRDPDLRADVQRSSRHLLVDEFQDLTPAFLVLLRLVGAPGYQVFGVGDDDQVIYGYAGADPGYLIDFDALFPGAAHYALEVNYRCPPTIVGAAANLLTHNRRRIEKAIRPAPDRPGLEGDYSVVEVEPGSTATETERHIEGWLAAGAPPSDIAVLARVNDALLPVQAALRDSGVGYVPTVRPTFIKRSSVRAALAYMRIALNPDDISWQDLTEVVSRPARKLNRALGETLPRRRRWTLDSLEAQSDAFASPARERFADFIAELSGLAAVADGATTSGLIAAIRGPIGLDQAAGLLDGSRSTLDRSTHTDALDALEQAGRYHDDPADFETWLQQLLSDPGDPDGVLLSSVHRVKGMEWPHVVVYGANNGLFPHGRADDTEEERRIFHVALTRARTTLVVVADRSRPSPFLRELDAPATATTTVRSPVRSATRRAARTPGVAVVRAEMGMRLSAPGGYEGRVVELEPTGVFIELETGAWLSVAYGETVDAGALHGILVASDEPDTAKVADVGDAPGSADPALLTALKNWRKERAAALGVPPFVVFHDKHLEAIAARRPATERQLIECPGIGPTKLEQYGEELLEVLDGFQG